MTRKILNCIIAYFLVIYIIMSKPQKGDSRSAPDSNSSNANSRPRLVPGQTKALAYLRSLQGCRNGFSIQRMAREADVSPATMWKALKGCPELRKNPRPDARSLAQRVPAWKTIKSRIEEDLLQNKLPRHGALPQIKELCIRYNAGFRTVSLALEGLREDGTLQRKGRSYLCAKPVCPAQPSLSMTLLVYTWHKGRPLSLMTKYDRDYVRDIEMEYIHRNIDIHLVPYHHEGNTSIVGPSRSGDTHRLDKRKKVDGYILPFQHHECLKGDILEQLHTSVKPVVLIDEMGGWDMPSYLANAGRALHVRARSFGTAAQEAGRQIVAHGHRNIAFFSAYHHDGWSHQCLEGLTKALIAAGCKPPAVFVENGSQIEMGYGSIETAWTREVNTKVRATYRECADAMPEGYNAQLYPFFTALFDEHLAYAESRHVMQRHFKACAANRQITCWVAADQDMAWFVSDFIRENCPGISVMSFGNSEAITNKRITAVDFNAPAAVHATIEFLLYPQRKLAGQQGMKLEIQSIVVDRGSLQLR